MTKLKSRYKHEQFRTCCVSRAYAGLYFERLSWKKHINYFKLGVNEHVIITHFHEFSKTFMIHVFFSMTFPGLEMTILKFHDFSRFSMTVRTLLKLQFCFHTAFLQKTNIRTVCEESRATGRTLAACSVGPRCQTLSRDKHRQRRAGRDSLCGLLSSSNHWFVGQEKRLSVSWLNYIITQCDVSRWEIRYDGGLTLL